MTKLEAAESMARLEKLVKDKGLAEIPERSAEKTPLQGHDHPASSVARPPGRVIGPAEESSPPPSPPTADDVRAYFDEVLAAAGRDPQRLGWLLDELKMRLEERRQWWSSFPAK